MKKGKVLFVIEQEPYALKVEQAKASEASARASLTQCPDRLRAAGRPGQKRQHDPGQARRRHRQPRQRPGQPRSIGRQPEAGPDRLQLHQRRRAVRRHRHRAQGLGRRLCRLQRVADRAGEHRAGRPDLCEFQHQRARRAAHPRRDPQARADAGGPQEGAGRGRAADRRGLSAQRPSRLRLAHGRYLDRHAVRPRRLRQFQAGDAARHVRARARADGRGAERAPGARRRARQRPERALSARRQQGQRGRAAHRHGGRARGRAAGDREGHQAGRPGHRRRPAARGPRPEGRAAYGRAGPAAK